MRKRTGRCGLVVILLATGLAYGAAATQPAEYKKDAGPFEVATLLTDWKDAKRDRTVPTKIYYPATGKGPFAVVIFSHGLGGSREGYAYLGRHWASYGYVSVHLQHEGSDDAVWKGQANRTEQMQRAAKDPRNVVNRPKDVSLAIDQLKTMNEAKDGPLHGRLDLDLIAVAGHSFGAWTALAIAGEGGNREAAGVKLADPRVKAAIPLSSPVPKFRKNYEGIYAGVKIPCLHMTGTLDESPIADTKAADRRIPYDHITKSDQYLVTFTGGDHMIFTGRPRVGPRGTKDAAFHDLIRQTATAFLDAYLKNDADAKAWLQGDGMKATMGKSANVEHKTAKKENKEE